jgi:cytochrome c oxidase subunit III
MWFSFRSGEGPGPWHGGDASGPEDPSSTTDLTGCGLSIFLASLTMLFGAALIGAIIVRAEQTDYEQTIDLGRSIGLTVATLLLWRAERALAGPSRGPRSALRRATLFGTLFLFAQAWNWWTLHVDGFGLYSRTIESVLFHMLTILHALHLFGGLIALLVVARHAGTGSAESARLARGLELCRRYWRYLGVLWLILLVPLLLF